MRVRASSTRTPPLGLLFAALSAAALHEPCIAQGQWQAPFQHDVTTNFPFIPVTPATNGTAFIGIQALLVAKPGPYRGYVFLLDHAPRQPGNPAYQRYALIKPGDPSVSVPHVFVNRTFTLPGPNQRSTQFPDPPGDFFCSHHVQTQDGNVFLAGGTVWSDPATDPVGFDGSKLVSVWDPTLDNGAGAGWTRQSRLQPHRHLRLREQGGAHASGVDDPSLRQRATAAGAAEHHVATAG